MKVSVQFHWYIVGNGMQHQKCQNCGAVHDVTPDKITLSTPGVPFAKLSAFYDYPEYKPYRVGPYRVMFQTGNIAKSYYEWDGETFRNGPMILSPGTIIAWQGLAGDNEHTKRMPYEHDAPLELPPCD